MRGSYIRVGQIGCTQSYAYTMYQRTYKNEEIKRTILFYIFYIYTENRRIAYFPLISSYRLLCFICIIMCVLYREMWITDDDSLDGEDDDDDVDQSAFYSMVYE